MGHFQLTTASTKKKEMGDNVHRAWAFSLCSAHTFPFPDAFYKKKKNQESTLIRELSAP